jgi:DNA end-binding protein Ku
MAHAFWKGQLKLALVNCPIELVPAVEPRAAVHFHWLNPKTHHRINMIPTDPETGPVPRDELVKGFEYQKNRYVVLTDKDFAKAKIPSTRILELEKFVPLDEVPPIYQDVPYYVLPSGKGSKETYRVVQEAMTREECVGIGRLVMGQRERLVALFPDERGLILFTLHTARELQDRAKVLTQAKSAKPDAELVQIAQAIIKRKRGHFQPTAIKDRYEEALRKVIQAKKRGRTLRAAPAEPKSKKIVNLRQALNASLPEKKPAPRRKRRAA